MRRCPSDGTLRSRPGFSVNNRNAVASPREHGESRRAGFPSGKLTSAAAVPERLGRLRQRLFVRHSQVMQFDPGHQLIRIVTVGRKSEILFYALDIRDISHGIQLLATRRGAAICVRGCNSSLALAIKNFTDYRNAAFGQSCTVFLNQTSTGRLSCTSAMLECRNIPVPSRKRRNTGIDLSRGNFHGSHQTIPSGLTSAQAPVKACRKAGIRSCNRISRRAVSELVGDPLRPDRTYKLRYRPAREPLASAFSTTKRICRRSLFSECCFSVAMSIRSGVRILYSESTLGAPKWNNVRNPHFWRSEPVL